MKYLCIFLAVLCLYTTTVKAQDEVCEACEVVAQLAEYYVEFEGYNATQVEAYLSQVCNYLPGVASECQAIVTLYLDEIVQEIISGTPADQVCSNIGLCSSSAAPMRKPQAHSRKMLKVKSKNF